VSRRAQAGLQHPLMGARLENLVRLFVRHGGCRPADTPLAAAMLASALARAPFRPLEALRYRWSRDSQAPAADPVFIIGHWRSGTTHLHNLLGCSPVFGHITPLASGLPDELLTLATWLRPWLERALPEDRHVDRVAVRPDSPQEDEIPLANLQPLSIFHALYFPAAFRREAARGIFLDDAAPAEIARWQRLAQHFANKVALQQGTSLLLVKNPVYTARLRLLLEIWPRARFIHIHRNPYEVFVSTRHYYHRMLADLALHDWDEVDVEGFVVETYQRLLAELDRQRPLLGPGQFSEVGYDQLREQPLDTLARIHAELDLPGWDSARPRIEAYLEQIRDYRRNRYALAPADIERVEQHWGEYLQRWGYARPGM